MNGLTVKEIKAHLRTLLSLTHSLGRLFFLKLLLQDSIEKKLETSEKGFLYLDFSIRVEFILLKSFSLKKRLYKWDEQVNKTVQTIIAANDLALLDAVVFDMETTTLRLTQFLIIQTKDDILLNHLTGILNELKGIFKQNPAQYLSAYSIDTLGSGDVDRVFFGPARIILDQIFDTSYDMLGYTLPENANTLKDIVPSCWSVAHGEMQACELCALSVIEYDNLPMQFYWDFAKQAWDEARHCKIYLDLALSFFDEVKLTLNQEDPLYVIIDAFQNNKARLPLPKDRNTYEAILNSSLEERIILLNILTEAPAVGRLTQKMKKDICVEYPQIKRVLEFDKVDEMFHAKIGSYWLSYLLPNLQERKQKIEDAKLLKGFLLLTSISEYSQTEIEDLAKEYMQ